MQSVPKGCAIRTDVKLQKGTCIELPIDYGTFYLSCEAVDSVNIWSYCIALL